MLANKIPTARLMARGLINWAVVLVSRIKGMSPREVVAVVRKIGRNLRSTDFNMASLEVYIPSAMNLLYLSMSIYESFTTTPPSAITPKSE